LIPHEQKLETEQALTFIKTTFAGELKRALNLYDVSAPLAVCSGTGINDDLNGTEEPVSFLLRAGARGEVVHSLAKWKRLRLRELGLREGYGILTDMRALRVQEAATPLHSIFVDQWDWEKRMHPRQRTFSFLKQAVNKIYKALKNTALRLCARFPHLEPVLPEEITFLSSEELLQQYPDHTSKEREKKAVQKHGALFLQL
jgi:aspartate--ammonia ligase